MTLALLIVSVLIVLVAAFVVSVVLRSQLSRRASDHGPSSLPYKSRTYLLSKGEAAFYHVLLPLVGNQCTIAMKVRLSDIVKCSREAWRAGYGNRIVQKHVDFVLIDARNTRILGVIELDDRSHDRQSRRDRDDFVDAVLGSAGIPIAHVRAASHYDRNAVRERLSAVLAPSQSTE